MQNRNNSPLRSDVIKRIIIYGGSVILLVSLQCAFFPLLDFCPATPDLLLGLLLAVCLLDNSESAFVVAICGGFFLDTVGSSGILIAPILYFVFVAFISIFAHKVLKSFASFSLLLIPTVLFRACVTFITRWISVALPDAAFITGVILPEAICTFLLALPLYFLLLLCTRTLESHSKFTF